MKCKNKIGQQTELPKAKGTKGNSNQP